MLNYYISKLVRIFIYYYLKKNNIYLALQLFLAVHRLMQDLKKETTCMQIEVSAEQAAQYSQYLEQFQTEFPQMQAEFQQSTQKIYYLVSCKFIEQWKNFCRDNANSRVQPQPMNSDLVDSENKQLLEGLLQTENFQIVNKKIYDKFKDFSIFAELKRIAFGQAGQKKVPIRTITLRYLTLSQKDLQFYDKKQKTRQNLKLSQIRSLSADNKIIDYMHQIESSQLISNKYETRIWRHEKDVSLDKFYDHIVKSCKPLGYQTMKIKALGKKIQNIQQKIGDLNIQQGDYFVLELIEHQKIAITSQDEGKCQKCYMFKKLTHFCNCKQVGYCSEQCLLGDRNYHEARCKFAEEQQLKKPIQMIIRQNSKRGLVGLQNLGNTCFMNSCLQCLSHTLPLTSYFICKKYAEQINQDNPIGSKGKLAQAYATFIKNMWCEQANVYRPYRLKSAIADINKMFSGYAQHDSQELFSFLVDGLHEDLNRVKRKPYVESVDSNGRHDDVVSRQSWLTYIKRNQSIISDTMVGQYKSKVICPDCQKQSITFDPFITVTLPIPQKTSSQISMYVLMNNNEQDTIKISLTYKQKNLQQIYNKISTIINKKTQDFLCYVLTFEQNIYPFHTTPKSELFAKIDQHSTYLFVIQLSPEEKAIPNRKQITCRFSKKQFYSKWQAFWFKRPFYFDFETVTGVDILKRVLKYLYADTYNHGSRRIQKEKQKYKHRTMNQQQFKPKSYQEYEAQRLKDRPFKVYVRWNKKLKMTYSSHYEAQFKDQKQLQDSENLKEFIQQNKIEEFEIDIRFNSQGLEQFGVGRLKNYTDKSQKQSSGWRNDEQQRNVTLDQCFEALQTPEQLEKGNEWYCSSCKDHKLATKQMYVYKTPQILILHLKRFKVKGIVRRQKNEANVDFPFELDMTKYIVNNEPINSYIPFVKSQNLYLNPSYDLQVHQNAKPIYELYAVSNHYGSLGGGHYTAFAKNDQRWFSFNDSSVSAVEHSRIKGSGAYMLFYRRKLK